MVAAEGALGALVAGLLAAPHCIVMCGPLAASTFGAGTVSKTSLLSYHLARGLSFALLGGLAGLFGSPLLRALEDRTGQLFPWALGLFFLALGLRIDRYLPKPKFLMPFLWRLSYRFKKLPPNTGPLVLGALTPLVPCGPLYLVVGLALLSGAFWSGFILLFGFACGSFLLLAPAHWGWARIQNRIPPAWLARVQRGLALLAACLIFGRLFFGCTGLFGLCSQ